MKKYLLILSMIMIACGSAEEVIVDGGSPKDSDTDVVQDVIILDATKDVIIDTGSDAKDAGKDCDNHHCHH